MIDFTLPEIQEHLEYLFETNRVREYNNSSLDAATRCFYEFEHLEDLTENIVIKLIIGQLLRKNGNRIFVGQYNLVADAIKEVFKYEDKLDLTSEEKIVVINLAKSLKKDLTKMIIENNPKAK